VYDATEGPVVRKVVSAACSCGETMTFTSFDEEDEEVSVTCLSCGRAWLMKRTDKGWVKVLVSETPPGGP
jgi:uncharacterized Zn finger protein